MPRKRLKEIGWDEDNLQKLLFRYIDRLLPEEELMVISQSRKWREEPDIMALDQNGDLWIFELKRWESNPSNLLQVLRYGQIFGRWGYEELLDHYSQNHKEILLEAHNIRFPDRKLAEDHINNAQHFVVLTNGLDESTRQVILYWRKKNLDVRPWIYRVYEASPKSYYFELNPFRTADDPFEDIEEGYYVVNTNIKHSDRDEKDMIKYQKAAAFFQPWKRSITKIEAGNHVFLYRSRNRRNRGGIIAAGIAKGRFRRKAWHDDPKYKDEEYYVELRNFRVIKKPITITEVRRMTGKEYSFRGTCFSLDRDSGARILEEFSKRQ